MTNWDYMNLGVQQGWQCPVCGRVNAPWLPCCSCGGKFGTYTTTDGTDYKPTESEYEAKRNNYMSKYQEELDKILDMLK